MKCFLIFGHNWDKWEVISDGTLLSTKDSLGLPLSPDKRFPIGKYEIQRRVCQDCGRSQLREIST